MYSIYISVIQHKFDLSLFTSLLYDIVHHELSFTHIFNYPSIFEDPNSSTQSIAKYNEYFPSYLNGSKQIASITSLLFFLFYLYTNKYEYECIFCWCPPMMNSILGPSSIQDLFRTSPCDLGRILCLHDSSAIQPTSWANHTQEWQQPDPHIPSLLFAHLLVSFDVLLNCLFLIEVSLHPQPQRLSIHTANEDIHHSHRPQRTLWFLTFSFLFLLCYRLHPFSSSTSLPVFSFSSSRVCLSINSRSVPCIVTLLDSTSRQQREGNQSAY